MGAKPKLTEAIVTGLLRERFSKTGNGGAGEYAFFAQVRNDAGFSANRTFDAVAFNLWPSRGMAIDVFEIKVSRSDWQRELSKPDKAEAACNIGDRFTVVAPAGCVWEGELPETWGLIEITGDGDEKPWKLKQTKAAPLLKPGKTATRPISRGLLVSLLRATPGAVPGGRLVSLDEKAISEARAAGYDQGRESTRHEVELAQEALARLRREVDAFQRASGVQITGWHVDQEQVGQAVKAILAGEDRAAQAEARIVKAQESLRAAADALDPFVTVSP